MNSSHHSNSLALLWALGIAGFLVNADNRAVAPILPAIALDFGVRESTAGLLVSAYSLPYGLFQLFYGPLADRFGKLRVMIAAVLFFSLGTLACGFIAHFSVLMLLRVITGIFAAGIIPIALAQLGDHFPFEKRQTAISSFMSFCMSGQALGIVIGSFLAQFYTWKTLFIIIGAAGIPSIILLMRCKSASSSPNELLPVRERYKAIFAQQNSRIVYLATFLEGTLFYGAFTYLGIYANLYLGLDFYLVGLFTAVFSLAAFIGSRFVPHILRKTGRHNMPFLGISLMALAFFIITVIVHWSALLFSFIFLGLGFIIAHSTFQTYASELFPSARGTTMSLFAFFLFIGSGIGPALFGLVYDLVGIKAMLLSAAILLALFAAYAKIAFRKLCK